MELFEIVFNRVAIYDMLFINTKSVLEYPTLDELKEKQPEMYERWKYIAETKHDDVKLTHEETYLKHAIQYPEFSKIVAITYASLYIDEADGKLKRYFKAIHNNDERIVIETFMDVLSQLSSDGAQSTPQKQYLICGHNVINHDIPLIIKRYIKHRNVIEVKNIPYILKSILNAKPWESKIIDTVNVYKFNGKEYSSLMLIADFLGLKKTTDLLPLNEVSEEYWRLYKEDGEAALKFVSLQSATQTNLVIQLMNELRVY